MVVDWNRPRLSTAAATVCLITAGFLASCHVETSSSSPSSSVSDSAANQTTAVPTTNTWADSTTTSQQSSGNGEIRLGCSWYCEAAGGYGAGGPTPPVQAVTFVSSGTVVPDPDGYLPVTLTCNLSVPCRGVLTLWWAQDIVSRSDLLLNGEQTQTFGIALPAVVLDPLRSNGSISVDVLADSGEAPDGDGHVDYSHYSNVELLTGNTLTLTVAR